MTLFALLVGMLVGSFVSTRRRCRIDRRLGLLPGSPMVSTTAASRVELGRVLHLDYEGGELVVVVVARRGGSA
jgi:hypothetical protein